jgi:hypothetical protein
MYDLKSKCNAVREQRQVDREDLAATRCWKRAKCPPQAFAQRVPSAIYWCA